MAGFENDIGFAKNFDFSQSDNQSPTESNGLVSNGELWIGSTAANAGGTHINVGTLTSPDSSLTVGYSSPNITLQIAGGTTTGKTITGNTGGALSPTAGNWNIPGINSALTGYSPWTSGSGSTLTVNMPGTVKWVVNPTSGLGTHTTIASAITSASSGDDIFITPGTYTENLTLKAGVNLVAYATDAFTPTVTISGTCTLTTAGTVTIAGIRLQTNSAALLAVTGSAASIVNLENCYLNCSNNTGITFSSSSSSAIINIRNCNGNIGTTGISLFSHSSAGNIEMFRTRITNSGGSTTASTCSSGVINISYCDLLFPITTSSTGASGIGYTNFSTGNTTALTLGGSGVQNIKFSGIQSGTASAISISSSAVVTACEINSTNTNAITGAGTIVYSGIVFTGSSNTINTTTQTPLVNRFGTQLSKTQPAFLGYLATTALNKTGTGTQYTLGTDALTEVFDQANNFNTNGTFTAPFTGKYSLCATVRVTGCTIANLIQFFAVTSNRQYHFINTRPASTGDLGATVSCIADMDAGDTCTWVVLTTGEVGNTNDILGASDCYTYVSGYLLC